MNIQKKINIPIDRLAETASTNEYLSELCAKGSVEEFHTVTAEHQSAGKGQRGNSWESEDRKNLLFSFVLYPTLLEAKSQFYLSMLVATGITHVLSDYTEGFSIKWPNDIYWKDRKIAGILIENILEGKYIAQCIVGIGLNVNQKEFRSSAPNPVSLCQITGAEMDREELLSKILQSIISLYNALENVGIPIQNAIQALYRNQLYRREGWHSYQDANGTFLAQFHQIAPDGHLYLKDEQGHIRRYAFKEVTFIL